MSDKIGVLGSASSIVTATATAYTCPANKAAKLKLMFLFQGNAGAGTIIDIIINGMIVATVAAMTASYYVFSVKGAGLRAAEQAAKPLGTTAALTVAPADMVYELSAGQTVQYTISGAAAIAANFQVIGTEIDV